MIFYNQEGSWVLYPVGWRNWRKSKDSVRSSNDRSIYSLLEKRKKDWNKDDALSVLNPLLFCVRFEAKEEILTRDVDNHLFLSLICIDLNLVVSWKLDVHPSKASLYPWQAERIPLEKTENPTSTLKSRFAFNTTNIKLEAHWVCHI